MKRLGKLILLVALGAAIGLLIREYVLGVSAVAGDSMQPTLMTGDRVLITRLDYIVGVPQRGDVVQLEIPGRDGEYLKRVVGLPGETVEIIGGVVHINGQALNETYATLSDDDFRIQLDEDEYFVLGDNRPVSYDSREEDFGVISAGCFRGRVRAIIWPLERIEFGIN